MCSSPGFGSFVEKTVMPYISTTPARLLNPCTGNQNCTSPFSYKNVLKLTDKGDEFNRLVSQQQISGNLDSPEGGFDAIMQVAVCEVRWGFFCFFVFAFFKLLLLVFYVYWGINPAGSLRISFWKKKTFFFFNYIGFHNQTASYLLWQIKIATATKYANNPRRRRGRRNTETFFFSKLFFF